jgi:hypothetical protein
MKPMLALCALAALALAALPSEARPKKTAQKKPPAEKVKLPEPDCSLSGGRKHADVVGKMHIKGTCKSLAATFAPDPSCAVPEGYRRPKGKEVDGKVGQKAVWWLSAGPSDAIWLSNDFDTTNKGVTRHYRMRTEYHCHNPGERGPQGWHKGVTVYIQK